MNNYIKFYAEKFNTTTQRVRYWSELTRPQKERASAQFSNMQMEQYV